MPEIYARAAIRLAVYAAIALVIGLSVGAAWGWGILCAVLLLTLARDVKSLERLRRWADSSLSGEVPEGRGSWAGVFDALYRRQRSEARGRMRLARALARSRQAGRALPHGVTLLDRDHRIAWSNDAAERDLGITLERDRGQTITHLVREPEFDAYLKARDYGKPLELKSRRPGGLLSAQLIPYAEGQWLLLTHDITQAARVEAMRRDFVANVSHELRTPLTVLVGFLETILELKLDAERSRDYLNFMQEQGRRMQRIIDDLLTLSTLESAPELDYDGRVDMSALLNRIHREAEVLSAGRHTIRLEFAAERDLLGSEDELASAFTNLVSNAVRYTPPGGEVRVSWHIREQGAEFAVEDTGPGLAPEHIPRLTERFYRVDRGRSRDTGGTGLGLAIVKHALARHQADLHIESVVGRGSRFSAIFPARRVAPRSVANVKH